MQENEIMVSVCCLVYNHEKYLRQCLDGFVMQKTSFKYEVLIHDDASTDGSADIIREYEAKYPDIIKPIYQVDNQYSKGINISWVYQFPRAQGKYTAMCEGDDYWTDEYKLQKQFDALENNDSCAFCTHDVRIVTESGDVVGRFGSLDEVDLYFQPADEWTRSIIRGTGIRIQTSSFFFFTSIVKKWCSNIPDFIKKYPVGDIPLMMLIAGEGGLLYINEVMSCYRSMSIGSWSERIWSNPEMRLKHHYARLEALKAYNEFTNYRYADDVDWAVRSTEFSILVIKKNYKELHSERYRDIYSRLKWKGKIRVYLECRCPEILAHYIKLKRKKI